jgi:hypothetical protein
MRRMLMIVLFLCGLAALSAIEKYNTAMGLHFGETTGNGYSIRNWGDTNAYQITFAAYATGDRNPEYDHYDFTGTDYRNARKNSISLGVNYLWGLLNAERYNFYLISGMSYTFRSVKRYYAPSDSKWVRDDRWAVGAGPGFEFEVSDRFHVCIEIPMKYNHKDDITMYIPSGGFYYYFK